MKTPFLLVVLALIGCSFKAQQISPKPFVANRESELERMVLTPVDTNRPPITINTEFGSKCPYCGAANISKSCTMGGSSTVRDESTDGNLEKWTITFECRKCEMAYSDQRQQFIPVINSVRLPILGQ